MPAPTLYEQLEPVLDPRYGLPLGAGGGRDNIIKDAAVALAVAARLLKGGPSFVTLANRVRAFITAATIPNYPGLLYREPGNSSSNSVDNLIGAVVAAGLSGDDYGYRALLHARDHRWTFSVEKPSAAFCVWFPWTWRYSKDWYGRFLGLRPFLEMAASYVPSDLSILAFLESTRFTVGTERGNTSDKILLWLQFELLRPPKGIASKAWSEFNATMERAYPGGPAELLGIYYGEAHPFAANARTTWGIL